MSDQGMPEEEDDILEIGSPMEPPVDLPSEGEDCLKETDHSAPGRAPPSLRSAVGADNSEIPKHLRPPVETPREEVLGYQENLPYEVESLEEMDQRLELIVRRLLDCVEAKDYDVGFVAWNHRLEMWLSLKYPMKRQVRAKLAQMYWELSVLPGMEPRLTELFANTCMTLIESRKRVDIRDLQLDWLPMYKILEKELFPKQRKTGRTNVYATLMTLTEYAARFFPPHAAPDMLSTFLPKLDGTSLDSILSTQAFLCHFLPTSHPARWRAMIFRLWEGFASGHWDDQWLDLLSRLCVKHMDPSISDPRVEEWLKRVSEGEDQGAVAKELATQSPDPSVIGTNSVPPGEWKGIRQDVGIFTDREWSYIATKCLRAMSVPIGSSKSSGAFLPSGAEVGAAHADTAVSDVITSMKKPSEKLHSLAIIYVWSMAEDGPATPAEATASEMPTPMGSEGDLPSLLRRSEEAASGLLNDQGRGQGRTVKKPKTFLGGSKALESLTKLLQATESFFHPSNYGSWQSRLSRFVQNLAWEFVRRWREESKPDCPTPRAWRLTEGIKKDFVGCLKGVCLLGMFSKDPEAMGSTQSAMKSLAYLEPGIMLPPVLERAFPALEGLLETQRTTACISALSNLAMPLVSRATWSQGAKHLLPALELLLPGIDLNDGFKTMTTSMFIIMAISTIKVGDLTAPEAADTSRVPTPQPIRRGEPELLINGELPGPSAKGGDETTRKEEDDAVRLSTAAFPDWVAKFMRQVLNLFENLPEPGKNNRPGGKMEEQLITMLISTVDYLCTAMSEEIFDATLKRFYNYAMTTTRTNTLKSTSLLVACFARSNHQKTFRLFFAVCAENIKYELKHGASRIRTTNTSSPESSDLMLHWYAALLVGASVHAGPVLLEFKAEIIDLLQTMIRECYHERGSTYATRFLSTVLVALVGIYSDDTRFTNRDEWEAEDMRTRHHLAWGKVYNLKQVKVDWHVPSNAEIDFAVEVLERVTTASLDRLSSLIHLEEQGNVDSDADKVWKNEFVRHCYVVKSSFSGICNLIEIGRPVTPGCAESDRGKTAPGFLDDVPSAKAGVRLKPDDPRWARVMNIKKRAAMTMHEAIERLKERRADDSIDSVKIIVSTVRTLLLDYPLERGTYDSHKKSYEFVRDYTRTSKAQKFYPRLVWVKRAILHHCLRLRHNSLYRVRSAIDDMLIRDLCALSLSHYTSVRKVAQRAIELISNAYDGTRSMLLDTLFDSLKPGSDPDRMKGALFMLGGKQFSGFFLQDWRYGPRYVLELLQCQHQDKPSVQNLVSSLVHETVIRLHEVSTIKSTLTTPALQKAVAEANAILALPPDPSLIQTLSIKAAARKTQKDQAYSELVPALLEIAQSSTSHWRFQLFAARFLRQLLRRDQPLDPEVGRFFAAQIISELPNKRAIALVAMTKMLHFVKLRSLCEGSDEKLLLQQTRNPLKKTVELEQPLPSDFTTKFIESFQRPIRNGEAETLLMDKQSTGWLVWGKDVDFYQVPPASQEALEWDPTSAVGLSVLGEVFGSASFWVALCASFAQEHNRNYLAADNVTAIKSIFQIFRMKPWPHLRPILEEYTADSDRHKQRAACELLGGILRGSKHWPLDQQEVVWDWLKPRLPQIFNAVTPDTQRAWEMFVEYVLGARDPRRNNPLVDYITTLHLDMDTTEAFGTAKAQYLVGSAIRSLSWHFDPWADKWLDTYWAAIDHPYQEVREAISENLRSLTELRLHPSFPSTEAFLADCQDPAGKSTQLMSVDPATEARIDHLVTMLESARKARLPAQHGSQTYDKAATTILSWLHSSLNDFRVTTVYPFASKLLPELFKMQELHDNKDLHDLTCAVTAAISGLPYPLNLVRPTLETLLGLLRTSDSWRVRLDVLPVLQVFYFHQLYVIGDEQVFDLLECLCGLLRDSNPEVRDAAATTLSGIVRCSQRRAILKLKARFLKVIRETKLPRRRLDNFGEERAGYQEKLITAHSGVLGATALINAFPYEVPTWMPDLLLETLGTHTSSPAPISTTVKQTLSDFKKSHQDSWSEDQKAFTEEQLTSLNDLLIGSSYYA